MTSPNLTAVVVSARAVEFDGHKQSYSVTERSTGRLMGHVAHTRNKHYGQKFGSWCYLGVTEERGTWTLAGWTRAEAVRSLQSWWSPSAAWVSVETASDVNPALFQ